MQFSRGLNEAVPADHEPWSTYHPSQPNRATYTAQWYEDQYNGAQGQYTHGYDSAVDVGDGGGARVRHGHDDDGGGNKVENGSDV